MATGQIMLCCTSAFTRSCSFGSNQFCQTAHFSISYTYRDSSSDRKPVIMAVCRDPQLTEMTSSFDGRSITRGVHNTFTHSVFALRSAKETRNLLADIHDCTWSYMVRTNRTVCSKHSDVILAGTCYDVITDTCHDTTLYYDVTAGIDYYVTLQLTSLLTPTVASRYIMTPLRVFAMTSYLFWHRY